MIIPVQYPAKRTISFSSDCVASQSAVYAYRRRSLEIPLARKLFFEFFVRKDAGGADFDEVAAELVLEVPVLVVPEVHVVVRAHGVEVPPPGIVPVKAHAPVRRSAT